MSVSDWMKRHNMSVQGQLNMEKLRDAPFLAADLGVPLALKGAMSFAKGMFGLSVAAAPFAMRMGAFTGMNAAKLGMAGGQAAFGAAKGAVSVSQALLTGRIGFGSGAGGIRNWRNWHPRPVTGGGIMPNLFKHGVSDPLERLAINPTVGRRVLWGAAALGAVQGVSKILNDAPEPSIYISEDGTPRHKNDMGATGDWAKSMRRKK